MTPTAKKISIGWTRDMPARIGCCSTPCNYMKIDPSTGDIIWQKLIGDGIKTTPWVLCVQPLVGTNDMLVIAGRSRGFGPMTLFRVDPDGAKVWSYYLGSAGITKRSVGSDGT